MAHSSRTHKIFETAITIEDKNINIQQLPTKLQVVRCILAHNKFDSSSTLNDSITNVTYQIGLIYERAAIPIVSEDSLRKRFKRLYEEYAQICKISPDRPNFEKKKKNIFG